MLSILIRQLRVQIQKLCDFEVIETNFYGAILVDKNTNVLYYWIQGDSMTPIYNSDGTVKLYDGE